MRHGDKKNRNIFDTAVVASHESGKILSFAEFLNVIRVTIREKISDYNNIHYYKNVPLHAWLPTIDQKKNQ